MTLNADNQIIPSAYALAAKQAGLNIITWSLERDGPLVNGGNWYHQSIKSVIKDDSQVYVVLDALVKQVGIKGIFSDWPATATYYANCMGLD